MTLAQKVARITVRGTMFGGLEEWSTGFYMGATGADATAPSDVFLSQVNDAWKLFFQNTQNLIHANYVTTEIRGALINKDGSTDKTSVKHFYVPIPYAGASSGTCYPPQCALVATLTTAQARGLGSKGRMYLPGMSHAIQSDGKITPTAAVNVATNLKTFFLALNGSVEHPGVVITASNGSKSSLFSNGVNRPVTGIRVGNVFDTQRRRRNALVESYSSVVV